MNIIDGHCDVLGRLFLHRDLSFTDRSEHSQATLPLLREGGIALQFFAMYLEEEEGIEELLEYVDLFKRKIASEPGVTAIMTKQDLDWSSRSGTLGALLTLEGVGPLAGNLTYLRILYDLGVRSVGITWNFANWAADGVKETRQGGFTEQGRQLIRECGQLGLLIDVSHLSDTGFWELAETYDKPFIASHSNTRRICPNPRNLDDEQIRLLAGRGGMIGATFVPYFVKEEGAQIADLLRHIDHFCSLGAARHLGFGSDFDGIRQWIPGLEHAGRYGNLVNELQKHYREDEVQGFLYQNWFRFLSDNLPNDKD